MSLSPLYQGIYVNFVHIDGCEMNNHTDLSLGEVVTMPCPCQEYLQNLLDNQEAWAVCGGSYISGAQLLDVDYSQCVTVADDLTHGLCHAAMVKYLHYLQAYLYHRCQSFTLINHAI